jgi:thiamine biosynthesis lipoprotein
MGTMVGITLADVVAREVEAERCIAGIERRIHVFAGEAWPWSDGALARFNAQLAWGESAAVPESLRPLFAAAWGVRERTSGLYEPRLAKLVELWGFDRVEQLRKRPPESAPIEAAVTALRAAPPYRDGEAHQATPGIAWDFGAIGKGWIAERIFDWLAMEGFEHALVDLGGQIAARGRRLDRPWRAGIRDPRSPALGPTLLASLELGDETVATHGDDQRCFEHDGVRYSHLLDPRSGWPAQGLRALTVVAADGVQADAKGAALFVAGPERWPALARELGIACVFAVHGDGRLRATAALAQRLALAESLSVEVV